ncbi:hypothetical protein L3X38_039526 [Prunus dulcis]|uniref:Uncharacterized protein n=1 Tax=Prunus dulcis TaxID=3755 RepID=A0AAD4V7M3_PRUDU|nr:hypothetical protein L3X38_039526 [Prunus dulcis]
MRFGDFSAMRNSFGHPVLPSREAARGRGILWSLNQAPRHQLTSKRDLQEVQRARTTSSRRAQGSTTGPFSNFRDFLLM